MKDDMGVGYRHSSDRILVKVRTLSFAIGLFTSTLGVLSRCQTDLTRENNVYERLLMMAQFDGDAIKFKD